MASILLTAATQSVPLDGAEPVAGIAVQQVGTGSAATDEEAPIAPLILRRDTPIHLMVVSEVTTKTHQPGHRFKLRVDKAVTVDGIVAIPVGATAWGEVLTAHKSGNAGKPGSLEAKLLYVEYDGLQIAISGTNSAKGAGGGGETALGILALGPLGLFAKGNNAKIKAGELMTGFVEQDVALPRPEQPGE